MTLMSSKGNLMDGNHIFIYSSTSCPNYPSSFCSLHGSLVTLSHPYFTFQINHHPRKVIVPYIIIRPVSSKVASYSCRHHTVHVGDNHTSFLGHHLPSEARQQTVVQSQSLADAHHHILFTEIIFFKMIANISVPLQTT